MKVIRQLLIAWMLVAFLVLQGFGQDAKPPPPPPPKPLPLPTKIITKPVSDENSSGIDDKLKLTTIKQRRTIKIPPRKIPPRKPVQGLDWSDFIYNSPEEKAFWDELPDWGTDWTVSLSSYKRNTQGQTIESNSSEGFNGYVKHKWGSIRTIYQFVDGYAVRKKSWYSNGQKSGEFKYKYGKPHGLRTIWHENGQKSSERNYKDGKKVGIWTSWHENGQKGSEGNYKDGELDGLWTWWYENGLKKKESNYKDGKLSYAKVWLPNGKACPKSKVIDGNGTLVTYSLDGKEIIRSIVTDGRKISIPLRNPLPIPKRPLVLSEANSTTRPRYMPTRSKPPSPPKIVPTQIPSLIKPKQESVSDENSSKPKAGVRKIVTGSGRTIIIPPRNPRPPPKRHASSEANSSKPLPPPPPKILPPATK